MKRINQIVFAGILLLAFNYCCAQKTPGKTAQVQWPAVTKTTKPWTRWWWMSSAVDEKNLDHLLTTYSEAGFGGVEVTPIYGATGYEKRYINFQDTKLIFLLNDNLFGSSQKF